MLVPRVDEIGTMWPWTGMWLPARVRRVLDVSHGRTMHSALLRCQWPIQLGIMHDIFWIDQLFCVAFDKVAHKMRVYKFEIVAPSVGMHVRAQVFRVCSALQLMHLAVKPLFCHRVGGQPDVHAARMVAARPYGT